MDENILSTNCPRVEDDRVGPSPSPESDDEQEATQRNFNPVFRLRIELGDLPGPIPTEEDIREALECMARAERGPWHAEPDGTEWQEMPADAPRLAHLLGYLLYLDDESDTAEAEQAAQITRAALAEIERAQEECVEACCLEKPEWPDAVYVKNKDGSKRPVLANAELMLRLAPEWRGVLAYDEFSLNVKMLRPAPWPGAKAGTTWTDQEDRLAAIWLQRHGVCVSDEIAGKAVQTVARDRYVHPVREYLRRLRWDGTRRIDTWLTAYLGVAASDYAAAVGSRWLLSAVARVFRPGCKADHCLILEGPQGARKSTALRTLAHPWFTDEIAELGSKDAALQTRGVWVIELAELDALNGAEAAKVKSFMSRSTDRFRPPYGRQIIDSPRQVVFAGTVNHSSYLKDETGGRRFWPVRCGEIRIEDLARDRDQLWAEAVVRYRRGSVWWLDTLDLNHLAQQEQGDRYEVDAWHDIIANWVQHPVPRPDEGPFTMPLTSTPQSVTIPEVLFHGIGKRPETWTQADRNRVARSLRAMGFQQYRERRAGGLEWRYRRK